MATAAGVSTASIPRYLSGQNVRAAEVIRAPIAALDYSPSTVARSLKTGRHGSIGVVVPDIMNLFFTHLVRGIDAGARRGDCRVILANGDPGKQG